MSSFLTGRYGYQRGINTGGISTKRFQYKHNHMTDKEIFKRLLDEGNEDQLFDFIMSCNISYERKNYICCKCLKAFTT